MLGLGISLAKGAFASIITYVKDGLKLFYNFTEHQDNPISHASTGSTSFDGTDDYISLGNDSSLQVGTSDFSFCAWVYRTVDDGAIFSWGDIASPPGWQLYESGAELLRLRIDDGGGGISSYSSTALPEDEWVHICLTVDRDSATGIKMYFNGSDVGVTEDDATGQQLTLSGGSIGAYIGVRYGGALANYHEGKIANVGIWSRALSASEVQGIMYKQYSELGSVDKASLVSWWGLDEDGLGSELLTNGTFDSDISGWVTEDGASGSSVTWDNGEMDLVRDNSSIQGSKVGTYLVTGLEVGALYKISCDVIARNYGVSIGLNTSRTDNNYNTEITGSGTVTSTGVGILWTYVKATATSEYVCIGLRNGEPATGTVDNVSIKKVDNDSHGTNDGAIDGATTNSTIYGDNAPQIPRILDVAQPKQAVQLSDGSTSFYINHYINCGTGLGNALGNSYDGGLSVCMWIKANVTSGDDGIFNIGTHGDPNSNGEFFLRVSSNVILMKIANADITSHAFTDTGVWHHVSGVFDGANNKSYQYLDGSLQTSDTTTSTLDLSGLKTIIGSYYNSAYGFDGSIANVGIWSRALTQTQIQEVMFAEKYSGLSSGLKTNLVSWYDLGDTSLGSNLVTSWANRGAVPYETFTSSGANITNAINTTGSSQVHAEVNLEVGKQYEITVDLTLDSGTAPFVGFQDAVGGSGGSVDAQLLSAGENTITTVAVANDNFLMFNNNATTTEFSAVVTLKEVLATDSQGSNDGSIYGATTTTGYTSSPHGVVDPINYGTIKSGTALSFDGTNDYVKIDSAIGDLGSSCTFSAWIYRNNTSDYHYIFDARNNSGSGYIQGNTGDTTINKSSGTIYVDGVASSTLATGGWHHLAITGMTINITQDVMIGVHLGGSSFTFPGKISNVKIFNSALTESEIQEMYLNPEQILPTGVSSSNLALHLPLNEGDGTINYDGSGNQNHGTITGATWDTANTDIAQVGLVRQNSPMIFDGSDDVVTITGIDVSYPQLSISVWFYGNTAGGGDHLFGITGTDTLNVYMTHGGGDVYLFRYGSGTSSISQTSTFTEGEWHHAVFIADSTNNVVKVYQNGTEIQSSAQTFDTPVYGAGFHIGARGVVGSPANTFNDNINEVAVFDTALTASEVTALYNSGTPIDATVNNTGNDYLISAVQTNFEHTDYIAYKLITTDNQADPDGGTDAVLLTPDSGDFDAYYYNDDKHTYYKDQKYKYTIWAKTVPGATFSGGVYDYPVLTIREALSSPRTHLTMELTTEWQEFSVEHTMTKDTGTLDVYIGGYGSYKTGDSPIYIYHPRLHEIGDYESSDDLQGYWRNDGVTTWTDRSTNSNNGTVAGSPDSIVLTEGLTSGRDSQGFYLTDTTENCLTLNGAEYVEVPDSEALDFGTGDFSIEAWIKTSAQGHMRIIDKKDASTGWLLSINTSEQLNYVLDDGGTDATYTGSTNISDGDWHHIVISADRSGNGIIYLDTAVDSTDDISARSASLDSTSSIFIGADAPSGDSLFFDGKIDDVRLYSKALSSDEVTKNYNAGKSKHS